MPSYNNIYGCYALEAVTVLRGIPMPDDIAVDVYAPDTDEHETRCRTAYNFFIQNDDRRYSGSMRRRIVGEENTTGLPWIVRVHLPMSYDEDTEVKSGGPLAVAAVWPNDGGRTLICTRQGDARRNGYGTLAMHAAMRVTPLLLWMHRENTAGQAFCLSLEFTNTRTNSSGGMAFERHESSDDGYEDNGYDDRNLLPVPGDVEPVNRESLRWSVVGDDEPADELERVEMDEPESRVVSAYRNVDNSTYTIGQTTFTSGDLNAAQLLEQRDVSLLERVRTVLRETRCQNYLAEDSLHHRTDQSYEDMCAEPECDTCSRWDYNEGQW